MNIIDLETPINTEKHLGPKTDDAYPFYITEYGKTFSNTPCYQLRINSSVSNIQYVISGSGVILYDGKTYTVNEGDTFMLLEGKDQIYYSNPDNQFERIWINFKGELSRSLIDIYKLKDTVVFKNTDTLEALEEMQKVCHSFSDPKKYKEETAKEFFKLVLLLADHKQSVPEAPSTIEEIRLYFDTHIMENISLNNVAKHFSFTKEHIIRFFKQTYGITPHQYIIQSKIRIAMIMLTTTDDTLLKISEKLNFSDLRHFSETFKKHVGLRPSEYKKASRK